MRIEPPLAPTGTRVSFASAAVPRTTTVRSPSAGPMTYANHLPSLERAFCRMVFQFLTSVGVMGRPPFDDEVLVVVAVWADAEPASAASARRPNEKRMGVCMGDLGKGGAFKFASGGAIVEFGDDRSLSFLSRLETPPPPPSRYFPSMPASSLLALIDDITTIMDDVALLTKVAAKKTSGVVGDDLALNAEQASGVRAERELPVVWAVAKGSMVNKLILVPAALLP